MGLPPLREQEEEEDEEEKEEVSVLYSFMYYFSKLEYVARCKAKNQNTVKTNCLLL